MARILQRPAHAAAAAQPNQLRGDAGHHSATLQLRDARRVGGREGSAWRSKMHRPQLPRSDPAAELAAHARVEDVHVGAVEDLEGWQAVAPVLQCCASQPRASREDLQEVAARGERAPPLSPRRVGGGDLRRRLQVLDHGDSARSCLPSGAAACQRQMARHRLLARGPAGPGQRRARSRPAARGPSEDLQRVLGHRRHEARELDLDLLHGVGATFARASELATSSRLRHLRQMAARARQGLPGPEQPAIGHARAAVVGIPLAFDVT